MIEVSETVVLDITINEPVLSIHNASDLLALLTSAASASDRNIELDFAAVDVVDSTAIAALVKFVQGLAGSRRSVFLKNLSPHIQQTFHLMKLSAILRIKEKGPHRGRLMGDDA